MRLMMLLAGAATIVALPAAAQDKNAEPGDRAAPRTDCPAPLRRTVNTFFSTRDENRAVLGIGTTSGGPRDTLGLLVTDVTSGGPAEKAGIEEGDRLVSANGTDLKIGAADAGDREMQGLMARRLIRVLAKLKAGDVATLRVSSEGKVHEVKVTTAKAADLFKEEGLMHFGADWGGNTGMALLHAQERLKDADKILGNSLGSLQELKIVSPDDDSDLQIYVPSAPTPPMPPEAPAAPSRSRRFMRITAPVAPVAPAAPAAPLSEITI